MSLESEVRHHYRRPSLTAELEALILRQGRSLEGLRPEDLEGIEDMHVGGRRATAFLMDLLRPQQGSLLLDLGSGLGGPARYAAAVYGARVVAVDLTLELLRAAVRLSRLVGLADSVRTAAANVLALPFPDGLFDAAYTIHVGMNVQDKRGFYREAARVLRPGGRFALYDVVRLEGEPDYPVPWAERPELSFLVHPEALVGLLEQAGFAVLEVHDRSAEGKAAMRESARRIADPESRSRASAPVVMGPRFADKIRHLHAALADGRIGLLAVLARKGHGP